MDGIQLNNFQHKMLLIPENVDIALLGGRGGGKSYGIAILILRHIENTRKKHEYCF